MEQTLGKRIMANRKRLGMTQDQLAEKLGVTAQAVSKWENDQSCPDITMLPRLAEIFGVSTDALLGREQTVYEAEVVDSEEKEPEGLHIQKGGFEFHYDNGKRSALGFAVLVLLVGGLLLAANLLSWEVSFWNILWPSALLVLGVFGLYPKFSFFSLGCTLFGGYFLLTNLHVITLGTGGKDLVLPVILVLFGLSLLADALRKPKKPKFQVTYNGKEHKGHRAPSNDYQVDGESVIYSASFGEQNQYISIPRLSCGKIDVSFGDYELDLSGVEEISEGCSIEANCSFGDLTLLVPSRYRVQCDSSTAFASVEVHGNPDANPEAVILLRASASFGEISVKYI